MRNDYRIQDGVATIILRRRDGIVLEALVDVDDLPKVKSIPGSWYAGWASTTRTYYAVAQVMTEPGRFVTTGLHRFITDCPSGRNVDHANHDTLDNRRANLRIVSQDQNMQNRQGANRNSRSSVRCVWWEPDRRKWRALIRVKGRRIDMGRFDRLFDAEAAVKAAIAQHMPFSQEAQEVSP